MTKYSQIIVPSRPVNPTRKEKHRFDMYWHLRDYWTAIYFNQPERAQEYGGYILKRIEQLGGLAARW
jgi:hypothetical protein